ncbi:MAG: phage tail protein [Mycetocola sp.]
MSAQRWLAHGDWATATLDGTAVEETELVLAAGTGAGARSARARQGTALLAAGRPDPAQIDSSTADRWRRVRLRLAAPVPDDCWLRVWLLVASGPGVQQPPSSDGGDGDRAPLPAPADRWRAAATGAIDVRVLCPDPGHLWIAVELGGDGSRSPRISDIQVETGDDGVVTELPVVYRETGHETATGIREADDGDGFLGRYLGLLGAQGRHTSSLLDELPILLNPAVAPDRDDSAWLRRLARWVAVDEALLPESLDERRETVSSAAERHGWRGTRRGLLDAIRRETGLTVELVEPLESANVWRLGDDAETAALGITTGLLTADPGPPVLDRTAILDQSMLVAEVDAGLPVHAHLAHRVCVHVPDGTPEQVRRVDAVVQRERPAHVLARTCAVHHGTTLPIEVGIDPLPPASPPGLENDVAFHPSIDGPGIRIGTARLPEDPDHSATGTTSPESKGRS